MLPGDADALLKKGIEALENGHEHLALTCFEQAAQIANSPLLASYLGYCRGIVRGEYSEACAMLEGAISQDPRNPLHYLHLARVLIASGDKRKAIEALRRGLQFSSNDALCAELDSLGTRIAPVFPSLGRCHPLNRFLGKVFSKLGMR
ncbi:MAG: tetratricopeptide repeat protein [Geobacter sp.]|nr:tetratricopeptide repeat protein [Geobacter sp.]